jgi:hypothetical protein
MLLRATKIKILCLIFLVPAMGCGGVRTTRYTNPDFNFGFVERVAVMPLENLTQDQQAGVRATRLLATELLASGAVDVVEPGEVTAALNRISGASLTPSTEQLVALGKALNVQAIIMGTVAQADTVMSGRVSVPVVTIDLHMVEVETGAPVWAATQSARGTTASARILGTAGEPLAETTRRCARELVARLVR